jgi:hypothetical protein
MAFVVKDRVLETTTTTGTGAVTLAGAVAGFQSFAVIGNANTTFYAIVETTGTAWEVGLGTYTSSGTTLARTTVYDSSNNGNTVNFGQGVKNVFVTSPAFASVFGPASSTDNAIARFDATTGKLLQNSGVTIDDNGVIRAPVVGSLIPFYFNETADFPGAGSYHGAIAHAHNPGRMYYAHDNNWKMLADAPNGSAAQLLANDGNSGFANITLGSGLSLANSILTASGGGGGSPNLDGGAPNSSYSAVDPINGGVP